LPALYALWFRIQPLLDRDPGEPPEHHAPATHDIVVA